MAPLISPYGSWRSPITSESIIQDNIGLGDPQAEGNSLYWLENRPLEAGRFALVRYADGRIQDLLESPFNVRSRVHEYGGGAYCVCDEVIYCIHGNDQRLYRLEADGRPTAVTAEGPWRYADLCVSPDQRWLIAVVEEHRNTTMPENWLGAIDLAAAQPATPIPIAQGHDFYAFPRLSPNGEQLAFIAWDHPNMPWDGSLLYCGNFSDAAQFQEARIIAGSADEAIFQPHWSPQGDLHFASDRSGWWNLYRQDRAGACSVLERAAEFGQPLWQFGMNSFRFDAAGGLLYRYFKDGQAHIGAMDSSGGQQREFTFADASVPVPWQGRWALRISEVNRPARIVVLSPHDGRIETLRCAAEAIPDQRYLSPGQAISFPTSDDAQAHAFYYPPRNGDYQAPEGDKPPLIVRSHGGPTASSHAGYDAATQFWTSRGFAVVDVNYRGSSGYGRAYRQALNGKWGLADVADCVHAAQYLVDQDLADADGLCIRGGSAGGYTTLCALAFHDLFRAAACRYGIGDLMTLAGDTHKFESRYLDRLVGPLPDAQEEYYRRSPIHYAAQISCPVIFFQGLEDKVVPPNQAEAMVAELRNKGLAVSYIAYEGEGHGFRQGATIRHALESEYYFYTKILGIDPADSLPTIEIENFVAHGE